MNNYTETMKNISAERKAKAPARIAQTERQIKLITDVMSTSYKQGNQKVLIAARKALGNAAMRLREYQWDLQNN